MYSQDGYRRYYVVEVLQVRTESENYSSHYYRQPYYKVKPWCDTGVLFAEDEGAYLLEHSLEDILQSIKRLSNIGKHRELWAPQDKLHRLVKGEDGVYTFKKDPYGLELDSWDGT